MLYNILFKYILVKSITKNSYNFINDNLNYNYNYTEIINQKNNMNKLKCLNELKNINYNKYIDLDKVNKDILYNNVSKYIPNLLAGDLFDDWLFII
jgi:hypothetical protein